MRMLEISSGANPRVKRWRKIKDSPRAVAKLGVTLAEGIHVALSAADSGIVPESVIVRSDAMNGEVAQALAALERMGVASAFELESALYESIAPVENASGLTIELTVPAVTCPAEPLSVDALYLDGVQDAGNVGTLIRTAVASGVRYIAASPRTAGLWSPKVMRAAMGAHFGAVLYENVEPEAIASLFAARRLAADARGGKDLFAAQDWECGNTVWMMGAEGPGLSQAALDAAQERYYIPIEAACESLNVGAAAAVCLFEQRRRRLSQHAN